MNERNIESMQQEKFWKRLADDANKDLHNPLNPEIAELNGKYNTIMAEYEKALDDGNDFAAESLLKQANEIGKKLNEIDPKLKSAQSGPIPSMEKLKDNSKALTAELIDEDKEILH